MKPRPATAAAPQPSRSGLRSLPRRASVTFAQSAPLRGRRQLEASMMAQGNSNWVVVDSEGEEDMDLRNAIPQPIHVPQPPHLNTTTTSPISDFTTSLTANQSGLTETSPVSQFPSHALGRPLTTSMDSITTPDPAPSKRARPKPKPAYKAAIEARAAAEPAAGINSATASSLSDPTTSSRTNSLVPTEHSAFNVHARSDPMQLDATNNDNTSSSIRKPLAFDGIELPRPKHSNAKPAKKDARKSPVIEITSDDDFSVSPKKSRVSPKLRRKAVFRVPDPPPIPSSSILPPSEPPSTVPSSRPASPVFAVPHLSSSPPSSPVISRPKKRKFMIMDDVGDFAGNAAAKSAPISKGTGASAPKAVEAEKKGKKTKKSTAETKEKKGKSKEKGTDTDGDVTKKMKKTKPKAKEVDQSLYKSKEFVDDSEGEDDLLLKPSSISASRAHDGESSMSGPSATSAPMSSRSVPGEPDASMMASVSASARPTAPVSIAPSADVSIAPSSMAGVFDRPSSSKSATKPPSATSSATVAEARGAAKKKKKKAAADAPMSKPDLTAAAGTSRPAEASNTPSPSSRPKFPSPLTEVIGKQSSKAKKRTLIESSDEDEPEPPKKLNSPKNKRIEAKDADKENEHGRIQAPASMPATPLPSSTKAPKSTPSMPPRRDSMSALIRRASSKVHSPLGTPSPRYIHSPLAKSGRGALSKIAPLHPNRRTPPPAPPRPPAPKKTKKMLELEEKWEEELSESVEGWSCMPEEERASLRRAKRDAELGYDD